MVTVVRASDGIIEEVDRERARVVAELNSGRITAHLEILVEQRDESVRVDVLSRSGVLDYPADRDRVDQLIRQLLTDLDVRLGRSRS